MPRVWQFEHRAGVPGQKSEIVAYDDRTETLWVAGVVGIDVLSRQTGQWLAHISATNFGVVNSVAIHDGLAALAVENGSDRTKPGVVVFYETRTRQQSRAAVPVGALPDMLTFRPSGKQVLVATDPGAVRYLEMITSDGDISPEGLKAFKASERYFLAVSNETSDTTS